MFLLMIVYCSSCHRKINTWIKSLSEGLWEMMLVTVDGNWLELALPGKDFNVPVAKEVVTPANGSLFALFPVARPSGVHLYKHWCVNLCFLEENSTPILFTSTWDNGPIYFLSLSLYFCFPISHFLSLKPNALRNSHKKHCESYWILSVVPA